MWHRPDAERSWREALAILTDLDHPHFIGKFEMPAVSRAPGDDPTPGFTHDVFVDRSGIGWITAQTGSPVMSMLLVMSCYVLSGAILLAVVQAAKVPGAARLAASH